MGRTRAHQIVVQRTIWHEFGHDAHVRFSRLANTTVLLSIATLNPELPQSQYTFLFAYIRSYTGSSFLILLFDRCSIQTHVDHDKGVLPPRVVANLCEFLT